MMSIWARRLGALILAALVTTLLASIAHSLSVQARLAALDVDMSFGTRMATMLRDFVGLAPSFGPVVLGALFLGFLIASFVKARTGRLLSMLAYPIAGFVAVGIALALMHLALHITPIAGARPPVGFLAICLAGFAGGFVYARASRPLVG